MIEYIGDAILSVNILGLGAYPLMLALAYGIAYNQSEGNMETFLITLIILLYSYSTFIFGITDQAGDYLISTIIVVTILMLPSGITEIAFKRKV